MIFIYIVLAVLLFGALVAIHELGHFLTAKLSKVRVNEFAIGMGPAILKKKFGETLYALRVLPFGGYCAMEGEDGESEDPRAFGSRPVFYRIIIVLAGSMMNLLVGFIVLAIVFAPVRKWYVPVVENVVSESELPDNALRAGDRITAVDGYNVYIFSDLDMGIMRGGEDGKYDIEVVRDDEKVILEGISFSGKDENSESKGYTVEFKIENSSFLKKIKYVLQNGFNLVRMVKVGLVDILTGSVSKDDISGPIGIGKVMADTAKENMSALWYLFAFISINLGVMNLLPIPALDGGRFIFLLFELVFRRKVPPKFEGIVHGAGLIILMLLMVLVTYNDIVKLIFK